MTLEQSDLLPHHHHGHCHHPQVMTLVFGAIPPIVIVLATPFLLPSVTQQKGVLAYMMMYAEKKDNYMRFYWCCSAIDNKQKIHGLVNPKPLGGRRRRQEGGREE